MTPHDKLLLVGKGVGALLLVASVIGLVLQQRARTDEQRAVVANLNSRIKAWWLMAAVLLVAFVQGKAATLVLFASMSFFALREVVALTPHRPSDARLIRLCYLVLIPVQYLLIAAGWYGMLTVFIPVYGFVLLPALAALTDDSEHFLERTAGLQWGVMTTVFCVSHAPALLLLDIPGYEGQDALLLFYLIAVVQLSDVLQYVWGKLLGKRKVAPVVSPSKTVEGLVGGGLSATLVGGALYGVTPFTPWQSLALAAVIVAMGFAGGLALSAVKRSLGAKDWGTMIEGHGGMLDRLDSVCFAAPVFFHLVRFVFSRS